MLTEQRKTGAKQKQIITLLERRVLHGDYVSTPIPPERKLADELGTNRITLRKAIEKLTQRGLLARQPNGRLIVTRPRGHHQAGLQIAYLTPAYSSAGFDMAKKSLEQAVEKIEGRVRPMSFVHWDDPVIRETFMSFDAVVLQPSTNRIPEDLLKYFNSEESCPVLLLEQDYSQYGIKCLIPYPANAIRQLMDHLWICGHRIIGCYNTQPHESTIDYRIREWQGWMEAHGLPGTLINRPVRAYESALIQGYQQMIGILKEKTYPEVTLWACTTSGAAYGLIRAMHEAGIRAGEDLSVCVMDWEEMHRFSVPALTSIMQPEIEPMLHHWLQWVQAGAIPEQWAHSNCLMPETTCIFEGETVKRL